MHANRARACLVGAAWAVATAAVTGSVGGGAVIPAGAGAEEAPTQLPGCGMLGEMALRGGGVSPQVLAAIGASDGQTATIATLALAACEANSYEISTSLRAREELASRIQQLEARVRGGTATGAEREQLLQDRERLADVRAADRDRTNTLLASVLQALSPEQREQVLAVRALAWAEVPLPQKFGSYSEAGWVRVRDAGESPMESGDGGTVTAAILLEARRHAVSEVWRETLGGG